jgi:hypothetical protein
MSFKTLLSILELAGLVIAIFDFKGWSRKIQAGIDWVRLWLFDWLSKEGHVTLANAIGNYVWRPGFALSIAIPIGYFISSPCLWALITAYVVLMFVPMLLLLLFLPIFYNLLRFINKPKTGTVGTVSLLVALGSFFLQRWDSIVRLWCRFVECSRTS